MFATRVNDRCCALVAPGGLAGCGQRGPLYMPDRNARVVTRPAAVRARLGSSAAASAARPPRRVRRETDPAAA